MLKNKLRKKEKIKKLAEKSKEVFNDCLLPNGCLVAAPSQMPYYPAQAKNYLYCWPGRDLGFNITGALYLGIDVFEEVLRWTWDRAERYDEDGLLYRSYHPNGRLREPAFQPDQTGTLLWAISEYGKVKGYSLLMKKIVKKSSQGLINAWDKDHFRFIAEDLWEERAVHPRFKNNLLYSLAACSVGLEKASEIVPNLKAIATSKEMKSLVKEGYDENRGHFLRRFGGNVPSDGNIDASTIGLVWPFQVVKPDDERTIKTIDAIEKTLLGEKGLYRYQFDDYDGEVDREGLAYHQGAGMWTLLTFWMSIVQNKMGNRRKAEKYFWMVLDELEDDLHIPEQFFPDGDPRVGVKPLLWSHMMFVHAAKELEYLD